MRISSSFHSLRQAFDAREGLRGILACTPLLLAGSALQMPELAWAVVGALWSTLAAATGSVRDRLRAMLAFGAVSSAFGGIASWVAGAGLVAATLAVLTFAGIAGVVRTCKPQAYQVAVLAVAACVLMMDRPVAGVRDCGFLVVYAIGCVYAAIVSAMVWRIAPPAADLDEARWSRPPAHFAIRLSVITALTYLAANLAHLRFGYWATMAVLLTLQPSRTDTWLRSTERALGTAAGTVIAMALGWAANMSLAALAFVSLIGLTMALRTYSYRVFVAFLTPAVILIADFAALVPGQAYALARLGDNLIGSVIALAASLLAWPASMQRRTGQDILKTQWRTPCNPIGARMAKASEDTQCYRNCRQQC